MNASSLWHALLGGGATDGLPLDEEILAEIDFHIGERTRDNIQAGMEPADARRDAEQRFGNTQRVRDACRWVHLGERIMMQRLHLALTIVLLLSTLGLGIALLSSRHALSLEPLGGGRTIFGVFPGLEKRPVTIGIGDKLDVLVASSGGAWVTDEPVASDGCVLIPQIGWVEVDGLTRPDAEAKISELAKDLLAKGLGVGPVHVRVEKATREELEASAWNVAGLSASGLRFELPGNAGFRVER